LYLRDSSRALSEIEKIEEQKPLLRLNAPVPDFEAATTQGKTRLSQYRGKWVMPFSHAADFTPVCTTEFLAFTSVGA
jgi:peroxiredoxin (alkyl hydroperoxide reductase subunit C)